MNDDKKVTYGKILNINIILSQLILIMGSKLLRANISKILFRDKMSKDFAHFIVPGISINFYKLINKFSKKIKQFIV